MNASATAYAKVNLALHIRRRRDDGYHDLETIFAFCEHGDLVRAEPSSAVSLTIDGPFGAGLSTTDNLVVAAVNALGTSAALHLTKYLPVASGIGGGSADAAAVLRLLRGARSDEALEAIAATLGADVPACVASKTVRGEGVGTRLTVAERVSGTPILLVNPRRPVSTAAVFARWDGLDRGPLIDWRDGRNDLEPAARAIAPEIGTLLAWLSRQHDVTFVRLSGSGATCFALFADLAGRDRAATAIIDVFEGYWTMASVLR